MKIPSTFKPEQLIFIYICALLFLIEVEYFFWIGLIYLACQLIGLQFTWGGATIIAILGIVLINLMKKKSTEENEENFKFTDKQWEALSLTLETANTQNNDDGAWTDIMFRAKYNFIESVFAFLNTQHVHLH